MAGMALSLRGLNTTDITFMTIPVATAPTDRNRVVWTSAATKIWANMVADKPIVASEAAATTPPATTTGDPDRRNERHRRGARGAIDPGTPAEDLPPRRPVHREQHRGRLRLTPPLPKVRSSVQTRVRRCRRR